MPKSEANPWLTIPLRDYEAHMEHVGQARMLSDAFADALARFRPESVALLGCAGGNGLERVPGSSARRIVAVDLNPEYAWRTRERFSASVPGLTVFAADIERGVAGFDSMDLVFAGLLFEYVAPGRALRRIRAMLLGGGSLVVVLQLPSGGPEVTPSPYTSLAALSGRVRLVDPDGLATMARAARLDLVGSRIEEVPGAKRFCVQEYSAR